MPLFRYLHDDAFLVFSREHKHLYAACLLDLHERFFTGAPAFPTPQQVPGPEVPVRLRAKTRCDPGA